MAAQRTLQATVAVERWVRSPLYDAGGESDSADSEEEQDPASAGGDEEDSSS